MAATQDLFTPIVIGDRIVASRVFLAPINTGFASRGLPTSSLIRFHCLRSGPEIGVSMVGNVSVDAQARTNSGTLLLSDPSVLGRFSALSRTISAHGSLAGIQLGYCPPGLNPRSNWVASDRTQEENRLRSLISTLSSTVFASALDSYVNSTRLAARAGFDVIQIHAAHGYLLSLILNPLTNGRKDYYRHDGKWLATFLERVLDAANTKLISTRLSIYSGLRDDPAEEIEWTASVSQVLDRMGVHILDYSAGFYTVDKRLIYPGAEKGPLPYYSLAYRLSEQVGAVVSCVGNALDLRNVPPIGRRMVVSVGRALIADPEFARKSKAGLFEAIVSCRHMGHCHYFSRGKQSIECGVNPEIARRR